jgi:hypothetical protein
MGIRPELWIDDSVKGKELPTSCITVSKHEKKEFCGFLKNVSFKTLEGVLWVLEKCVSTIRLLDEQLKTYFISRSKSSSRCEVS